MWCEFVIRLIMNARINSEEMILRVSMAGKNTKASSRDSNDKRGTVSTQLLFSY